MIREIHFYILFFSRSTMTHQMFLQKHNSLNMQYINPRTLIVLTCHEKKTDYFTTLFHVLKHNFLQTGSIYIFKISPPLLLILLHLLKLKLLFYNFFLLDMLCNGGQCSAEIFWCYYTRTHRIQCNMKWSKNTSHSVQHEVVQEHIAFSATWSGQLYTYL